MSRSRPSTAAQPSFVAFADMLTNVVGVAIFLLVFAALSAGAVTVLRRLPMEHESDAHAEFFLLKGGRAYHLDTSLRKALVDRVGKFTDFETWTKSFDGLSERDADFVATAKAGYVKQQLGGMTVLRPEASVHFEPREGGGEPAREFASATSRMRAVLHSLDPGSRFAFFFVAPDSIDAFTALRAVALARGLSTGWAPHTDKTIGLVVIGQGVGAKPD